MRKIMVNKKNQIMCEEYRDSLERYKSKDAIYALVFYLICLSFSFFQGYLFKTSMSVNALTASQVIIPIVELVLCMIFVLFFRNNLSTIGINTKNIGLSLVLGVCAATLLLMFQFVVNLLQNSVNASLQIAAGITFLMFTVGAVVEEFIFRGYIQTRLSGVIKNPMITSVITAIMFLFMHYPVKWVILGTFSIGLLSGLHIVCLLLLHFLCDLVYKKTNCLWGSILLHFLYNIIGAMIIYA